MKYLKLPMLLVLFLAAAAFLPVDKEAAPKQLLSQYGFFVGKISELKPAEHLIGYDVVAPLFTDYAEKSRYIVLAEGSQMKLKPDGNFNMPAGTTVIKNFFYTDPKIAKKTVKETRLLIKTDESWKALTYVWRMDQSDADLEIAGTTLPATYTNPSGEIHHFNYQVPNLNQCKGCHSYDGKFTLLGLTAAQLAENDQLTTWQAKGWLDMTETPKDFKPLCDYTDPNQSLDARARSYLHANCGHCHNAHGPASTSGMFLDINETNEERLGVGKAPVAAGRGSGNRKFGLVPGAPDKSILLYRMESLDPGIKMPELGRELAHTEGVALIRDWIENYPKR